MKPIKDLKTLLFSCVLLIFCGCLGPSKEDIPRLLKQLKHKEAHLRNQAALDLGRVGPDAKPAVRGLAAALRDENGGVRSSAAFALRKIGTPEATRALDAYRK